MLSAGSGGQFRHLFHVWPTVSSSLFLFVFEDRALGDVEADISEGISHEVALGRADEQKRWNVCYGKMAVEMKYEPIYVKFEI